MNIADTNHVGGSTPNRSFRLRFDVCCLFVCCKKQKKFPQNLMLAETPTWLRNPTFYFFNYRIRSLDYSNVYILKFISYIVFVQIQFFYIKSRLFDLYFGQSSLSFPHQIVTTILFLYTERLFDLLLQDKNVRQIRRSIKNIGQHKLTINLMDN